MSETNDEREPDVVDRLLGTVDHLLDVVHDRVLRPILIGARALAFGLIIALCALVVVAALVIALVRLLNVYAFASHQWITYGAIGALFVAVGLVLWRRRRPIKLRD